MTRIHSALSAGALLGMALALSGCAPMNITLDPRSLAWGVLTCLVIIVLQTAVIGLLLAQHPRMRRFLRHCGLAQPRLETTRHQLYQEIARHEATEELLRETQEYLQNIINSIPSVLIGVTADGFVTHWNTAAEQATGLSAEEAIGAHVEQCYPGLPVDSATIHDVTDTAVPYVRENVRCGHGSHTRFIDVSICALTTHEIRGAVVLADDVTSRVRLESMMIQNEKMMSLGELAAGLAHEINNPLAGILNNVQNILRRTSANLEANEIAAQEVGITVEQLQAYLHRRQVTDFVLSVKEAGERAAHIVKNMLEFSRGGGNLHHSRVDFVELVMHSLELATNTFELETTAGIERPKIEQDFAANVPLIRCSPSEIQQVILNLLRNAAQAFRIDDYGPPLDPKIVLRIYRDGNYVCLKIEDNGPGMPEHVRRHIFEPFFTTKEVGQGTGLGLSVSYFIVTEHHQGSIEVDSHPGIGTTFTICLPIGGESAVTAGDSPH